MVGGETGYIFNKQKKKNKKNNNNGRKPNRPNIYEVRNMEKQVCYTPKLKNVTMLMQYSFYVTLPGRIE